MKFEKLTDNKIRIILTNKDLNENHIDYHSFMSNSAETQDLFLSMLERAEEEIGFVTKDYKIRIDALAMTDGDFILTVTRMLPEREKKETSKEKGLSSTKCKVKVKRKSQNIESASDIAYRFVCFDDFYDFVESAHSSRLNLKKLARLVTLYRFEGNFYLILQEVNFAHPDLLKLSSFVTEFGSFVNSADVFIPKIKENGKVVMKSNALLTALKHF